MVVIWIISIIATIIIADQKKLGVGAYFVLSFLTGPLAVMIALLVSSKNAEKVNTVQDAQRQLSDLKNSLFAIQQKINSLELSINKLSGRDTFAHPAEEAESVPEDKIEKVDIIDGQIVPAEIARKEAVGRSGKTSDMELDFGRNWLNKIGIAVFTLGMGFLISYTFKYFGPFFKILFGYFVSSILFVLGCKLEVKEKFVNFGRVLLGGGWALVYFTTYAMHHFEASRIIQNQFLDLLLLTFVVIGMMGHVLKYKNEGMMSIALFVAYLTTTLGQITGFTIISCMLLALVILFLVYNFQWIKTFILGVILTYGIHYVWVTPNIEASNRQAVLLGVVTPDYYLFMSFIFLTVYWVVFLAGAHVARTSQRLQFINTLAATNFGNIAVYSILSYPIVLKLFYSQRFALVLGAGIIYLVLALVMKRTGREKLYISDIVAAIFSITFSILLKFLPTSTLLMWLIEIPFLLYVGLNFKEKIFRCLSYALTVFVLFRLIFLCFFESMADVHFFGLIWTWQEFMSLWASISMAACFYLTRRAKKSSAFDSFDGGFDQVFSATSCIYLTSLLTSFIKQPWVSFALSIEGLALLAVSVFLVLMRFRIYTYLILGSAAGIFMMENIHAASSLLKWFIIGFDVLVFFAVYFLMKYLNQIKQIDLMFEKEEALAFWAGLVLLIFATFQYVHSQWISLSLGIAGVLIILIGILTEDKIERLGGLLLLGLTLGRVIFVDLSGLDIIFKIITFIILGILFVGISFIYNRSNIGQKK